MMSPDTITVAIFAAGGYVVMLRTAMRHINGLGRKYSRLAALMIRWADTPEKLNQVADLIEGKDSR